jgi:hypothetical protein
MAQKKLWKYTTPNDYYLRAPITQPAVTAENYEIKPHFYVWSNITNLEARL